MKCPPHSPRPPPSPHIILFHSISNHWDTPQALFQVFFIEAPPPCPPTLFKPSLSTISYDNTTFLNAVMSILSRKISTRQASSVYNVPYRKIINITTALESAQEQRVTTLVENYNQQQIYRWVRKYLLLPLCRGDYTDWELRQSVEGIILLESGCATIHEDFGVPNTYLQRYLNLIFPPLKISSLKHLWYLMSLG